MRLWLVAAACCAPTLAASIAGPTPIEQGYHQMYNLDFDGAHRSFGEWERQHPKDPVGPVSDAAAFLFAEFDRLHILQSQFFVDDSAFHGMKKPEADERVRKSFEDDLEKGRQLADAALRQSPGDKNATFANVLRMGLHADYLSLIEERNLQALSEMKTGRIVAEKLLSIDPAFYDAYLAVGVENYMLSLKPAPARWLLRLSGAQTSKEEGIEKMKLVAQNGHYLQPFARLLLAVQNLRDKNIAAAKQLLSGLAQEFPGNHLYSQELAKLR